MLGHYWPGVEPVGISILHQSAVVHLRNVLRGPIRRGIVRELLEASLGADDEALHIESFPVQAKRLQCAYSLIELAHCSLLVFRRNVVHADCDVYQRLEEIAIPSAGTRPSILEEIMTFEIQFSIKEICGLGEDIFVGHRQMLPLGLLTL